jgi:hypothetical protein
MHTEIPDAKGTIIKDGDIVEGWCNSHKLRGQVFWNGDAFRIHELYRMKDGKWIESGELNDFDYYGLQLDYHKKGRSDYVIIGNISHNPRFTR